MSESPYHGRMTCPWCEKRIPILRALLGYKYCCAEHWRLASAGTNISGFQRLVNAASSDGRPADWISIQPQQTERKPLTNETYRADGSIRCVRAYGSLSCRCSQCV